MPPRRAGTARRLLPWYSIEMGSRDRAEPEALVLCAAQMRAMLLLDMLIGVLLMWRLVPRIDARRIRPGSACMAVAVIMALGFGVATILV